MLALDLCDLEWGTASEGAVGQSRVGADRAIVTRFSRPAPVPALLLEHAVTATVGDSFADAAHPLPAGLRSIVGVGG